MDESVIDVDSLFREAFAEQAAEPATPTAPPPAPEPPPAATSAPEERGAPPAAPASVPPTPVGDSDAAQPAEKAEKAEKPAEENRLAKLENDLALAKKAQAAADKKNAELERRYKALEDAKLREAAFIQEHIQSGTLTQEILNGAPQRMDGYVRYQESLAEEAETKAANEAAIARAEQARAERDAELELQRQAIPLTKERIELGLSETEIDPETVLREVLASDKYAPDVALTWKLQSDPAEAARIYTRLMESARADVKAQMSALAEAKRTTETAKAARNQYDRTSSPGPSSGGVDPLPNMQPEDHFRTYYAERRI